jgi:hypothetical protein
MNLAVPTGKAGVINLTQDLTFIDDEDRFNAVMQSDWKIGNPKKG